MHAILDESVLEYYGHRRSRRNEGVLYPNRKQDALGLISP